MRIKWSKESSSEDWAVYNGRVEGRLRFTVVGERFGSHVDNWSLSGFGFDHPVRVPEKKLLRDAKSHAQILIDNERTFADLERNDHA